MRDQRYPGPKEGAHGTFIAADPVTGDVFVAGEYSGTLDIGAGQLPWKAASKGGLFVARYHADGNPLWTSGFVGSAGNVVSVGWVGLSGSDFSGWNLLVVGSLSGDTDLGCGMLHGGETGSPFLLSLGGDGECIWSTVFGGDGVVPLAAAIEGTGDVLVAGRAQEGQPVFLDCGIGQPMAGGFVTKRSGDDGSCLWARMISGSGESVAIDASSSIYVAGTLHGSMPFAGMTLTAMNEGEDALLLKYDEKGNDVWAQHGGGSSPDSTAHAYSVAVTQDQRVWFAGSYAGYVTFGPKTFGHEGNNAGFVFGVTPSGAPAAAISLTTADDGILLQGPSIAVSRTGSLVVAGRFQNNITVGGTMLTAPSPEASFLAKLDPNHALSPEWALALDHAGVYGISVDPCDDVFVTGSFAGPLGFAGPPEFGCGQKGAPAGNGFFWSRLGP